MHASITAGFKYAPETKVVNIIAIQIDPPTAIGSPLDIPIVNIKKNVPIASAAIFLKSSIL